MVIELGKCDLRILSLLHALGDREEIIREAVRLLRTPDMNEASWSKVRGIGNDIAPEHPLFDSEKTFHQLQTEFSEFSEDGVTQIVFDRRKEERRVVQRREVSVRRSEERRITRLPWLGKERREGERRLAMRR